jgi:hypothetical protein
MVIRSASKPRFVGAFLEAVKATTMYATRAPLSQRVGPRPSTARGVVRTVAGMKVRASERACVTNPHVDPHVRERPRDNQQNAQELVATKKVKVVASKDIVSCVEQGSKVEPQTHPWLQGVHLDADLLHSPCI